MLTSGNNVGTAPTYTIYTRGGGQLPNPDEIQGFSPLLPTHQPSKVVSVLIFFQNFSLNNCSFYECEFGIFERRAMVDQAVRASATSEKLNILVYLTLKRSSVLS